MPMQGEPSRGTPLEELVLSESKDTLLKYNGSDQIVDLSKYAELANVKVIGRDAFADNLKIREVILPSNVHTIGMELSQNVED